MVLVIPAFLAALFSKLGAAAAAGGIGGGSVLGGAAGGAGAATGAAGAATGAASVMGPSGAAGAIGPQAGPLLSAGGPQTAAGALMQKAVPNTVFGGSGAVGSPVSSIGKEAVITQQPKMMSFNKPADPVDPGNLSQFLSMVAGPVQGTNERLHLGTSGKGEQLTQLQSIYHKFSGTGKRR